MTKKKTIFILTWLFLCFQKTAASAQPFFSLQQPCFINHRYPPPRQTRVTPIKASLNANQLIHFLEKEEKENRFTKTLLITMLTFEIIMDTKNNKKKEEQSLELMKEMHEHHTHYLNNLFTQPQNLSSPPININESFSFKDTESIIENVIKEKKEKKEKWNMLFFAIQKGEKAIQEMLTQMIADILHENNEEKITAIARRIHHLLFHHKDPHYTLSKKMLQRAIEQSLLKNQNTPD